MLALSLPSPGPMLSRVASVSYSDSAVSTPRPGSTPSSAAPLTPVSSVADAVSLADTDAGDERVLRLVLHDPAVHTDDITLIGTGNC